MVKDFRYAEDNGIVFFFSKSQEEMEVTNRQMTMTMIFAQLDTGHCVAYPRYAKIIFFIFSIPCDGFLTETKGMWFGNLFLSIPKHSSFHRSLSFVIPLVLLSLRPICTVICYEYIYKRIRTKIAWPFDQIKAEIINRNKKKMKPNLIQRNGQNN